MLQTNQINKTSGAINNLIVDEDDEPSVGRLDLDKLLPILNKSLGWIILFIVFSGAAGHLYLRWTRPVYESVSVLKLDEKKQIEEVLGRGGSGGSLTADEMSKSRLSGEIELIRSNIIYSKIIENLPLDINYFQFGKFLYSELYKTSPFKVEYQIKNPLIYDVSIDLELLNGKEYILKYKLGNEDIADRFKFGRYYENDFLKFKIDLTKFYQAELDGSKYFFTINSRGAINRYLEAGLSANILKASANTIQITFKDFSPEKARDVVKTVDSVYLEQTIQKKNQATDQKLAFLSHLIDTTEKKLELSEREVEAFVRRNKGKDVEGNLARLLDRLEGLTQQIDAISAEMTYLNDLALLVVKNKEVTGMLPNMKLISDPQIVDLTTKLNELQMELKTMVFTTKENSTAGKIKKAKLEELRSNLSQIIQLHNKDLKKILERAMSEKLGLEANFNNLPGAETELNRIQRFFSLNERFYLLLIERQAEFGMMKAGTVPDFQILAPASLPTVAISPNKGSVYSLWILIGVVAGVVLVLVRYILQDTVVTMKEIERRIAAPLLGVVPVYTKEKLRHAKLVVDKNPKSSLSESLRAIRTNIDFMSSGNEKKKVISVTSTVASEGKTFIAVNLSGVLALSNQKVCLIDLDLRKPKLHLAFEIPNDKGISTVLIGKHTMEECISHTTAENIDVIPAGPAPPNPSELLLRPILDEVIATLLETYDVVVIDSPPVGLVTDGIIVMQKADLPIYVVRSEYSKRVYLKNINKLVRVNGFKNLCVILNGLDKFKTYGYGYGYGYDYYTDDDVPQGFDVSWFRNLLGVDK